MRESAGPSGAEQEEIAAPNARAATRWQRPLWEALIFGLFADFLLRPLTSQSLLYAELRAGLQIIGMTLYFLNDVFRLNFALEAAKSALNRLALLQSNFSQTKSPPNQAINGNV